jgi:hypothetical protein
VQRRGAARGTTRPKFDSVKSNRVHKYIHIQSVARLSISTALTSRSRSHSRHRRRLRRLGAQCRRTRRIKQPVFQHLCRYPVLRLYRYAIAAVSVESSFAAPVLRYLTERRLFLLNTIILCLLLAGRPTPFQLEVRRRRKRARCRRQLGREIGHLRSSIETVLRLVWNGMATHREDKAVAQGRDPVFVPQEVQQLLIEPSLVDLDLERVVGIGVNAEILNLVHRNGLVRGGSGRRSVSLWSDGYSHGAHLWIRAESADLNLAGGHGAVWIDLRQRGDGVFDSRPRLGKGR